MSSSEPTSSPDFGHQSNPSNLYSQLPESNDDHVNVGRIIRAHGLNGQLRVRVLSDVPERFQPGQGVYIDDSQFTIRSFGIFRGDEILLTLVGVDSRNAAQKFVDNWITVPREAVPPLPEGEWFHFQLLGLRVITGQGEELGKITEILETGSNDVYVVTLAGTEILIPAIKSVITEVRLEDGIMLVALPDGLR